MSGTYVSYLWRTGDFMIITIFNITITVTIDF